MDIADIRTLFAADRGDFSVLIDRLRDPKHTLTLGERQLAAEIIEGRRKRPQNRPRTQAQIEREEAMIDFLITLWVSRYSLEVARERVADLQGVSVESVKRYERGFKHSRPGEFEQRARWRRDHVVRTATDLLEERRDEMDSEAVEFYKSILAHRPRLGG